MARYATLGLLLGAAFGAEDETGQEAFKQDLAAARSGNARAALLLQTGSNGGAFFYNRGVTHYKAGAVLGGACRLRG